MEGELSGIVRDLTDAAGRHTSVDEFMAEVGHLFHAEVEYVNPPDALETGTRTGLNGMKLVFANFIEGAGANASFEINERFERGEQVFQSGLVLARGTASGIEVPGRPYAIITTFRDGLIYRMEWFWDKADALALMG